MSYPVSAGAFRLSFRNNRVPARITVGVALLLVGAGASTGLLLQGGGQGEDPTSKARIPAQAVPKNPSPSAAPSSPEPFKATKAPSTPVPSATQPKALSATPSPKQECAGPRAGTREARRALESADEVTRKWTGRGAAHWSGGPAASAGDRPWWTRCTATGPDRDGRPPGARNWRGGGAGPQ
ncbi:hypothetical protein [Streptomyces winkii]|uniref:hypothetical protein n=1 Tax=Streptomyces winkii TaxID=3051178 RepID=UPI0028D3D255|nr:hypothetical protein [Streptomyces sp. DSM 40971]